MKRLWTVLAVAALLAMPATDFAAETGTLRGRFIYDGEPPAPRALKIDKDVDVCAKNKKTDESLVVDPKTRGIANVVVALLAEKPPKHPDLKKKLAQSPLWKIEDCRMEPHVMFAIAGQTLKTQNVDAVGHNVNIHLVTNAPRGDTISAGAVKEWKLAKPERSPVIASDSIHPWIRGYLFVTDHPYIAVTARDGAFAIPELPPGEWTFRAWQERAGYIEDVSLGERTKWIKGQFTLDIQVG